MEILCIGFVVLSILVLALIGAIYVVTAAFRAMNSDPNFSRPPIRVKPARRPVDSDQQEEIADLRITLRRLTQFRSESLIDEDAYQRLRLHILQQQRDTSFRPVLRETPAPINAPEDAILEALPVVTHVREPLPPLKPVALPVEAPPRPRRSWGELLASFMEERHILWGELIGGMLIVGCSVALVLSLWQTLKLSLPMFPFLILAALTSALFGVGRYTLRRWKLEATSHGLLVIATLLVPLNFLVLAGLSAQSNGALIELAIKFASIPLFGWLVYRGGAQLFAAREAVLLAVAVVGAAISPLPVPRLFDPENSLWLLPAVWAVLCYGVCVVLLLWRRWAESEIEPRAAWDVLGFLGLATFPLALVLGFIGIWAASHEADVRLVMHRLSLPVVLAGAPLAATGLFVMRRTGAGLARIAATGVALVGMLLHATTLAGAWPEPIVLIVVGLIIATAWTAAAIAFRLPMAHVAALIGLTAAILAGAHPTEPLGLRQVISGETGVVLAALAIALTLVADRLRSRGLWNHGSIHAVFAAIWMTAGLALVGSQSVAYPLRAAAVAGVAAAICLVLDRRWAMPALGQIGGCLIPLATLAALHGLLPEQQSLWGTLLAIEALALCAVRPAVRPAVLLAVVASIASGIALGHYAAGWHTATLGVLALVAVIQSHQLRNEPLTWLGSAAFLASIGHLLYVRPEAPWALNGPLVFLIHATVLLPTLFLRRVRIMEFVARPLSNSALISSLAAAGVLGWYIGPAHWTAAAFGAIWLAGIWLLFAVVDRLPGCYTMSQAATAMAAILGVAAAMEMDQILVVGLVRYFDLFGLVLTGLVVAWTVLRIARRHPLWDETEWPAFERVLLGSLVIGAAALAVFHVVSGMAAEFGASRGLPEMTRSFGILGGGEWLLVVALAVALLVQFRAVREAWQHEIVLIGLLIVYLTVPALIAFEFTDRLAVASALRWGLGVAYLLGCVPFWCQGSLVSIARKFGVQCDDSHSWANFVPGLRVALLAVAGGVPFVLTLITMLSLLDGGSLPGPGDGTIFRRIGFTWSHGFPLALAAAGMVGHALRERSPRYVFSAGLLVKFLVCGGFLVAVGTAHRTFDELVWIELGHRFAIAAGAWAMGWLVVSRLMGQFQNVTTPWHEKPSTWWNGQFALAAVSAALPLVLAAILMALFREFPPWISQFGAWPGWLALVLALAAADMRSQFAGRDHAAPLIGIGVSAAVVLLAATIPMQYFGWPFRTLTLGWAACAVAWSLLARWRPTRGMHLGLAFTAAVTLVLSSTDMFIHVESDWRLRLMPSLAVGFVALATGLFPATIERSRLSLATFSMSLVVAAVAALGISLVPPDSTALWLHRSVAVLTALSLGTVGYAFGLRRPGRWADAAFELAPKLGLIAAGVMVLIVVQEGFMFDKVTRQTPLHLGEVCLLLAATVGLMTASIAFAVRPEIDPFRVPERWRASYVYACEVLLVLLFLHLRFNVPGIFPKIEAQTWAFVIMGIAFAGVGLGEFLRRYRLDVLVKPIQRTGLFLPLLPLMMFWMKPPAEMRESLISFMPGTQPLLAFFDQIPNNYGTYSILWFLFGLLYAWLAISRQSFRHALFAALAGNVGIWSLLQSGEISMMAHPQLWLVPLALIILVSEQIQHANLRPEMSTGLRYTGLGLLYLSSTADFFLAGLGNSVVLPLALAMLSIAGVLIGILLRVKSYLFLGTGFLALVVFSMIWHAAVDLSHTWLWFASGIVLGAAILALFALFEKRRQSVVHAIDELRTWR